MDECKPLMYGAYTQHAFGRDELAPVSQTGVDDFGGIGATLIDSLVRRCRLALSNPR